MPGDASLRAGQYYAHPRNVFWKLLCELLGAAPGLPYADRVRLLKARRIALWDVLASCAREGSLDAAIDEASAVANDFPAFFKTHRSIAQVLFNGAKAEACFRRHVMPVLAADGPSPHGFARLPSTSPAHAAMPYALKRSAWRAALEPCLPEPTARPRRS